MCDYFACEYGHDAVANPKHTNHIEIGQFSDLRDDHVGVLAAVGRVDDGKQRLYHADVGVVSIGQHDDGSTLTQVGDAKVAMIHWTA